MADLTNAGGILFFNTVPLEDGPRYLWGSGDEIPGGITAKPVSLEYRPPDPQPVPISQVPFWMYDPGDLPLVTPYLTGGGTLFLNHVPLDTGPQYQWSGDVITQLPATLAVSAEEWRPFAPVIEEPKYLVQYLLDPGDLPFRYALDGDGFILFGGVIDEPTIIEPGGFESGELSVAPNPIGYDVWESFQLKNPPQIPPNSIPSPNWWNDPFPTAPTAPPDDQSWISFAPLQPPRVPIEQIMQMWNDQVSIIPPIFEPDADIIGLLRQPVPLPAHRLTQYWPFEMEWVPFSIVPAPGLPHTLDISVPRTTLDITGAGGTTLGFLDDSGNPMATPITFTAGETGPLTLTLTGSGVAENLATAASTTLRVVSKKNGQSIVNGVALINGTSQGTAVWVRQSSEISTPGVYSAQAKVIRADGTVGYYPDGERGVQITILAPV